MSNAETAPLKETVPAHPRVLVVEDDDYCGRRMTGIVVDLGLETVSEKPVKTAEEAIQLIEGSALRNGDIVLLDYNLAGRLNGNHVAEAIKRFEKESGQGIVIVATTSVGGVLKDADHRIPKDTSGWSALGNLFSRLKQKDRKS